MNTNKTTPFIIGIIVIAIVILFVFMQRGSKKEMPPTKVPTTPTEQSTTQVESPKVEVKTETKVETKTTSTTAKEYTLAEVATHNTKSNCWTTINGGVYNVTAWISRHPGGESAIISLCGTDGSDVFNGKHGGQPRPASELAGFKIGTLKK